AVGGVALGRSESIARLVSAIPLHWVVAGQVYRVAGGIFLVLWADGRLPWQFALPAGIGDVATGSVAVVVAALLAQNAIGAHRATYAWCLFRNRRPCPRNHHRGNDFSGTRASSSVRGAEPSHVVISAGHGATLRRSVGPGAPWRRSMAAAARCRLSRAVGTLHQQRQGGRPGYRPRLVE